MTWTAADGKLLKDLRTAAGLDRATLARRCTISTGQLVELEDGGTGRFYSEGIKAHTGRTVLAKLGHVKAVEVPAVPTPAATPASDSQAWSQAQAAATELPTRDMFLRPEPAEPEQQAADQGAHPESTTESGRTWPWIVGLVLVASAAGVALWLRGAGTPAAPAPVAATSPATPAADSTATESPAQAAAPSPASEPAAPAAPIERAASVAAVGPCTLPASATTVAFTPERALKASSYVYLEANEAVSVCVVDARQRRMGATVTPAEGVTLSGAPPFTVHTPRWAALRVYFQGIRVPLDDPGLQGGSLVLQPAS